MRRLLAAALLAALLPVPAGALLPQNDAGSGRDAPNAADSGFRIVPGRAYEGTIEGIGLDAADWYAFDAPAGARIEARASGALGCFYLTAADGTELDSSCTVGAALGAALAATAPATGTYYVSYSYLQPDSYRFTVGVDGRATIQHPVGLGFLGVGGGLPRVAPASPTDRHTVIAVVDTGINPYHEFFRAPRLTAHPSGWLKGFPKSAEPVRLTLDAKDYAAANAADAGKWEALERSTFQPVANEFDEHLYTFPGTRVVAGISFGEYQDTPVTLTGGQLPIRDDDGHGTHSAGLAAGGNLDRADGNVLVVAVEVGKGTFDEGIRWAARQPWIDALTVSLGTVANVPLSGGMERITYEAHKSGKPVFVASGNGFSNSGITPDHCSTYTSGYTGPQWVTRIGAAEGDDGSPTWWHCVPVDAIARTNVYSTVHDALTGDTISTGTSAATPNAAGHFAHLLLAARRVGSTVTRARLVEYLLRSAAPVTFRPGLSDPSVYPLSLADQGYGLVDQRALDDAVTRLLTRKEPLPRPETETWFAQDAAIRRTLWPAP